MASKSKKRAPVNKITIFASACIGGLLLAVAIYFAVHGQKKAPPPIYEEMFTKSSDLDQAIRGIDRAIYRALYQGKIAEGNISFPSVVPRHQKGYDWDFTEVLINLPQQDAILQIDALLKAEISTLRPDIRYETKQGPDNDLVGTISALGFVTHRIRLRQEDSKTYRTPRLPKVAILLDDLGYDMGMARALIKFDLPLSLSLLPVAPYHEDIVREANRQGAELMLHLPMEPKGYPRLDPGPGALLTRMKDDEIRRILADHLERIPGVRGVNNHMGSYFTEQTDKMGVVLEVLKKRHLFYVDSRTSGGTVAYKLAKGMGVPVGKRSVFLDNDLTPKAIHFQMERLLGIARHAGKAIGIGHPHRETLKVLDKYQKKLKTEVEMVPVSQIVG